MNQTFIKICGVTNASDAEACIKLGANAIGIVFFKKSPRNMHIEDAKKLCSLISHRTMTTGVFVDETYDFIMKTVTTCNLKAVQLHGNESSDLVKNIAGHGIKVIKALFKKKEPFTDRINLYEDAWAYLVEQGDGALPGGTAGKWSWSLDIDAKISADKKIIIAGGLEPGDVARAVAASGAFGVDVSSGVESSPGIKDLYKVKEFIQQTKYF